MNNRIRQFMDSKGLSSSELADSIGVQRSNVTHVLQGRNKPGFLFISKLLETYPDVNAKWLITGQGEMLIGEPKKEVVDLFDTPAMEEQPPNVSANTPPTERHEPEQKISTSSETSDVLSTILASSGKSIERIVVFYNDQTFKQYLPSK
ncbi:helix-turn-helix domain-containing protein [Mangrovibacterium marinum]|uniref:Helix-turn-helix protein n=1 Tax=Mangrovibacterium marinum TaxID=1639118 RepID=A0A2T5C3K4_9BACT|nr:helix-turn-helix transcriptional regulator [Mangrovibacterium marinum]PTN09333.1 helix-turn-helix protein [Mangrovibacterium marinum]